MTSITVTMLVPAAAAADDDNDDNEPLQSFVFFHMCKNKENLQHTEFIKRTQSTFAVGVIITIMVIMKKSN